MSTPEKTLTVRSPADLVAAVPYLLGFHPDDGSVVVVVFNNRRVTFVARGDLPDRGATTAQVQNPAAHLTQVVRRQQPITDAVIIGYGDAQHVEPPLRTFDRTFTAQDVPIRDLLRVTDRRIFSLLCDNPACCPPQGIPFDSRTSLISVQATAAGQVAFPDRAAVAARFAPVGGADRDAMRRATGEAITRAASLRDAGDAAAHEAGARAVRAALRQHDAGKRLADDEVAWLTVLVTRPSVRDLAMELTEPHDQHVTFWAEVTRRAEQPLVPAPATLLALAAWRCGDGALALLAVEHALAIEPTYELAGLLEQALHVGLPPSEFFDQP
ncbi:DUF4192 domain-containing protein [Micromonospora sp. NPDC049497]|uniref:DUF4192 domain-containing protein n=1 Tax=Micromonospora sp. NPDC049497 TaxID=3364273 RepID=UPI00378F9657